MNKNLEEVARAYRQEGNIKAAAKLLGISPATVLKALCTQGIYPTEQAATVHRLLAGGWTAEEIQAHLGISKKQYAKYMPYTKGSYALTQTVSKNAERVRASRERKALGMSKLDMHPDASPLAKMRLERGLTQRELALRSDIPAHRVSDYETGARKPSVKTAEKLAKGLSCTLRELLACIPDNK